MRMSKPKDECDSEGSTSAGPVPGGSTTDSSHASEEEPGKWCGRLSRIMATVLRHTSTSLGLQLRPDGFALVAELIALPPLLDVGATLNDVQQVVAWEARSSKKQRFSMRTGSRGPEIRANQGHSVQGVDDRQLACPIAPNKLPALVLHGTYLGQLNQILVEGLRPMGRQHIHLFVEEMGVGRQGAEVLIYVDVVRAAAAGVEFLISENGVLLSTGDLEGSIPPACFRRVVRVRDGAPLHGLVNGKLPGGMAGQASNASERSLARTTATPASKRSCATTSTAPRQKYVPPHRRAAQ